MPDNPDKKKITIDLPVSYDNHYESSRQSTTDCLNPISAIEALKGLKSFLARQKERESSRKSDRILDKGVHEEWRSDLDYEIKKDEFELECPAVATIFIEFVWDVGIVDDRKMIKDVSERDEMSVREDVRSEDFSYETHEWIPATKSKTAKIGRSGGDIDMGDCVISFPENAFNPSSEDHETDVQVTLEVDSSKWPAGYICICPILHVNCSDELQKPALVSVSSWCFNGDPNENDHDHEKVHLLHLPEDSTQWEVLELLTLTELPYFEFTCSDFSPITLGFLRRAFSKNKTFLISGYMFEKPQSHFTVAFCIDNETLKDRLKHFHGTFDGQRIEFDTIESKLNDTIELKTEFSPAHFQFGDSDTRFSVAIDEKFVAMKKKSSFTEYIKNQRKQTETVEVKCKICKNDVVIDEQHKFMHKWQDSSRDAVPPPPLTVKGEKIQVTLDNRQRFNANAMATNGSNMTFTPTGCTMVAGQQEPSEDNRDQLSPTEARLPIRENDQMIERVTTSDDAID